MIESEKQTGSGKRTGGIGVGGGERNVRGGDTDGYRDERVCEMVIKRVMYARMRRNVKERTKRDYMRSLENQTCGKGNDARRVGNDRCGLIPTPSSAAGEHERNDAEEHSTCSTPSDPLWERTSKIRADDGARGIINPLTSAFP